MQHTMSIGWTHTHTDASWRGKENMWTRKRVASLKWFVMVLVLATYVFQNDVCIYMILSVLVLPTKIYVVVECIFVWSYNFSTRSNSLSNFYFSSLHFIKFLFVCVFSFTSSFFFWEWRPNLSSVLVFGFGISDNQWNSLHLWWVIIGLPTMDSCNSRLAFYLSSCFRVSQIAHNAI